MQASATDTPTTISLRTHQLHTDYKGCRVAQRESYSTTHKHATCCATMCNGCCLSDATAEIAVGLMPLKSREHCCHHAGNGCAVALQYAHTVPMAPKVIWCCQVQQALALLLCCTTGAVHRLYPAICTCCSPASSALPLCPAAASAQGLRQALLCLHHRQQQQHATPA